MLKVKVNTLDLEIENLVNELQHNGMLTYAFNLFIINRKTLSLNKEKIKVKYEVRKVENRIADEERKMMQLKSDLKKIKKSFTTKIRESFISFAIFFFFFLMKCTIIQILFKPSWNNFILYYWHIFK